MKKKNLETGLHKRRYPNKYEDNNDGACYAWNRLELIRPPSLFFLSLSLYPPIFLSYTFFLFLLLPTAPSSFSFGSLHGRLNRSIQRSGRLPSSHFLAASSLFIPLAYHRSFLPVRPVRARAFCSMLKPPPATLASFTCVCFFLSPVLQCWQYCEALENRWEKTRTICEGDQYLHVSKFTGEAIFWIRQIVLQKEFSVSWTT